MSRVMIIGGGIAGTVTAIALDKAGFEPVIYEAYERTAEGVGAFLTLAVNGLDALDALGLKDLVKAKGFDTPGMALHNGNDRCLASFELGGALPDGTVTQTIQRSELYVGLRDEATRRGIRIEYGKRVLDANGSRARFADGSEAEGDLLIGADGLHSRVRRIIDPAAPEARYLGLLNTGGVARGVSVDGPVGRMHMIFGKRCFFAYVLHPNGDVWWFANPVRAREPRDLEVTGEQWRAELLRLFERDHTPARKIIEATPEIYPPWATHDFPSVPTWHRDRMIIIGDAAHATSPASGQGASMAIEDAVTLGRCLRDSSGIEKAFVVYESLRRKRVEAIVKQGKRNGDQKAVGPVMRVMRDFFVAWFFKKMASREEDPLRWMWDHHIEWDERVAA